MSFFSNVCVYIYIYIYTGKNVLLPISPKRCSKMSLFWNYLTKYPYFETQFSKNWVLHWNSIFRKSSFRQSNLNIYIYIYIYILWNSSSMWIFPNNSIFIKSSFTLKLDFLKIESQNEGILLHLLGERGECPFWLACYPTCAI